MKLLREKGIATRLLILREIILNDAHTLKPIAINVGVSQQAVSDYIRRMKKEGMVRTTDGGLKTTIKGVDFLQKGLLELKYFADSSISQLEIIRSTDAIAMETIRKGEGVSLLMRDGLLYAKSGEDGPSTGIADTGGEFGDVISVSELEGVLDLGEGKLVIVEIVPAREGGGSYRPSKDDFLTFVTSGAGRLENARLVSLDLEASALLLRMGVKHRMDIPGVDAIKGMIDRGLDVVALGTPHSVNGLKEELSRTEKIPITIKFSPD